MYILVLISCLFLVCDLVASSIVQKEVPDCVSRCWYIIGWYHYALLTAAAFVLLPVLIEHTNSEYQALAFFTCAGVLVVGAAPNYFDKDEKMVHFISASLSAVCSIAWLITSFPYGLPFLSIALIGFLDPKRKLLYAELSCFFSIYLSLYMMWMLR